MRKTTNIENQIKLVNLKIDSLEIKKEAVQVKRQNLLNEETQIIIKIERLEHHLSKLREQLSELD